METLEVKYSVSGNAKVPQPLRMRIGGWSGGPEKMRNGSNGQPWHCRPFSDGSTYGLELVYPHETECQIISEKGTTRIEFDFASEPGGKLSGGEFVRFAPLQACKYYMFNLRVDVLPPPGWTIRIEPHPRYFTDDTGTVPLAVISNLESEWYPRELFVVFRSPPPGGRHFFRKDEPFAQIIFVPRQVRYDFTVMDPKEADHRRKLDRDIQLVKDEIATNVWHNVDGAQMNNHYKILAAAFDRGGITAVEAAVREAVERRSRKGPPAPTISECLALGAKELAARHYREAEEIYTFIIQQDPQNAEAMSQLGVCVACVGNIPQGLSMMSRAIQMQPLMPKLHSSIGEVLRLLGRFREAEAAFREFVRLNPNDAGIWSALGLTLSQQGRHAEGYELSRRALSIDPGIAAVQYRMGLIQVELGQTTEARASFTRALELDPKNGDARRALDHLPP